MKEYKNPEYKTGKSKIKSFYTSNNVETLGSTKIVDTNNSNTITNSQYSTKIVSKFSSYGFFRIFVILLLFASLFRLVSGSFSIPTFGSLLDLLSNVPDINSGITWFIQKLTIPDFPWPINWVSWVLNQILDLFSVIVWMGSSVLTIFSFYAYFVVWLFVL